MPHILHLVVIQYTVCVAFVALAVIVTGRSRPGGLTPYSPPRYASSPAAMSSETAAELADLVHEWLRIDRVRVDNVLT